MSKLFGVIDIGSNSVRLMISDGEKTLLKRSVNTRLAEGQENGVLKSESLKRTVEAVVFLNNEAKKQGAGEVFAFATAALRQASNGALFTEAVKSFCGLDIDVLSGEKEAEIGFLGALNGKDGGLIDVGGASSEVMVVKGGKTEYVYSLPVGAVKIKDVCGQDRDSADSFIKEKIKEYGSVPFAEFTAIGGTATSCAAILQNMPFYDRKKTDGYKINSDELKALSDRLFSMTVEERKKIPSLQPQRAEIIAGGALLLYRIAEKLGLDFFSVSEKDNLEGYLYSKVKNYEKKN